MSKTYAIVENGIVVNVIISDDDFISQFHPDSAHPYEEVHEDDNLVARIGDSFVDGKFITPQPVPVQVTSITKVQAMRQLKAMSLWATFNEALATNKDAQDEWDLALGLDINDPFVSEISTALNISDIQALFNEASKL